MTKNLNGSKIISLLKELDRHVTEPCRIIICGGAAAIVGYGMKRLTGDIDILEPFPKNESFYKAVKDLSKCHSLDPKWINDGVKGFLDDLNPDFQKRLIPLNEGFENLHVFIISKPDLITMKICAWREADKEDIEALGISKEDLTIINSNLVYIEKHSPDRAHKANLVLSELGVQELRILKADEVTSLAELIQYYRQHEKKDVSIEEIRNWRDEIEKGMKPSSLAKSISEGKQIEDPSIDREI
jgi:hypothetical protein